MRTPSASHSETVTVPAPVALPVCAGRRLLLCTLLLLLLPPLLSLPLLPL